MKPCLFIVVVATLFASPSAFAQDLPRIGIAVPLSGEYAALGRQLVEAAQFAAAEHEMQLLVRDTDGTPEGAAKAVAELEKSGVIAVVGPLGRRESQAAAVAAQREKLPLFSLSTWHQIERVGPWVYRVRQSPAEQARHMADVAIDRLNLKTAAVLYPQTPYGDEASTAFAEQFTSRGGRVTAVANYPIDTTDYQHVLDVVAGKRAYVGKKFKVGRYRADAHGFARVRRKAQIDFKALFIPDFHHRVAHILPFLPLAGMQNGDGGEGVGVQLLGLAGWHGKTMEFSGGAGAGALYPDVFAGEAQGGAADDFSRAFEAATGRKPTDIEAETYDVTWLLGSIATLVAAQKNGRAALRKRVPHKHAWRGVCGELAFDESGAPRRSPGLFRFDSDGSVSPVD